MNDTMTKDYRFLPHARKDASGQPIEAVIRGWVGRGQAVISVPWTDMGRFDASCWYMEVTREDTAAQLEVNQKLLLWIARIGR